MDLHKLKIFKVVYEEGSFTKAAEKIHISQPAVSIQIKNLEERYGLILFDKLGKNITPTEAGRVLYRYAVRIFQEVENAEKALTDIKNLERGQLVLGASTTPGTYILPEILGCFKKAYPRVQTKLQITNSRQIINSILQNKIELGVIGGKKQYPPQIKSRTLCQDELVVITPRDFSYTGSQLSPADLKGQDFILREPGSDTRKHTLKLLELIDGRQRISLELTGPEAVKEAVRAGLGISLISSLAIKKEALAGQIKVFSLKNFLSQRPLDIIWHKDKHLNRLIKAFLETLDKYIDLF